MKKEKSALEVWQRGPIPGIPALLQPVAHALLQAQEEIHLLMVDFDNQLLWQQPAGLASPAFHLQHISGVIDRLFTYAKELPLTTKQLELLGNEGKQNTMETVASLVEKLDETIAIAIADLSFTDTTTLSEFRAVGRARLPSTVIGLLIHAAEHTMRHLGQLLVTVKVLKAT
ncbi:MAG: DinB family protein [Bacteroidota bacterium]